MKRTYIAQTDFRRWVAVVQGEQRFAAKRREDVRWFLREAKKNSGELTTELIP